MLIFTAQLGQGAVQEAEPDWMTWCSTAVGTLSPLVLAYNLPSIQSSSLLGDQFTLVSCQVFNHGRSVLTLMPHFSNASRPVAVTQWL